MDYLTPEDAEINKYDPFDSDDLEKSVGGTIAKNVAAVQANFGTICKKAGGKHGE